MLRVFLLLLCITCTKEVYADQTLFKRYTYWSLLTSQQIEQVRLGARGMGREQISDPMILDVAAAVLWQLRANHHNDEYVDAMSWLAKDLSMAGSQRYQAFLLRCQQEFARNEKLTKYVSEALSKVKSSPSADSFSVEDVDLNSIRTQLLSMQQTSSEQHTFDAKSEVTLVNGETLLSEIYQTLGLPVFFDVSFRSESVPGIVHWDVSYLRIWYPNIGGFRFSYDEDDNAGWRLMDKWPITLSAPLRYSGLELGLAYALWTTDPKLLRETHRRLFQQRVTTTPTLDVIADRLWLSLRDPQPQLVDALAWGCKVLEQSRNGRYRTVLNDVASNSQDKKLAKYAKDALEELSSLEVELYAPRVELKAN